MWSLWTLGVVIAAIASIVDCVRRKALAPLLGVGWSTRILWIVLLASLEPVLIVLYWLGSGPRRGEGARSRVRTAAVIVVSLIVATFGGWPRSSIGTSAFTFERGEDGEWEVVEGEDSHAGISYHYTRERFTVSKSASTAQNAASHDLLRCRDVVLWNRSDDLLVRRTAVAIVQRLIGYQPIHSVRYLPSGATLEGGARGADLWIVLEAPKVERTRHPFATRYRVRLNVDVGPRPFASDLCEPFDPAAPFRELKWNTTVDYEGRVFGVCSTLALDAPAGETIGRDIASAVVELLEKPRADGKLALSAFPASGEGSYRETARLPFLGGSGARCIVSVAGPLLHNQTTWLWTTPWNEGTGDRIHDEMSPSGWHINGHSHGDARCVMTRGDEWFCVARRSRGRTGARNDGKARGPEELVVLYEHRFSRDEVRRVALELLDSADSAAATEWLVALSPYYTGDSLLRYRQTLEIPAPEGDAFGE